MDHSGATGGEGPEPIAVIGSGCRLPGGVKSPSDLWELLKNPRELITDISSAKTSRFNSQRFFHPDGEHHGASNVSDCYLCDEDFRVFDNDFFGIHAREAESMDPQQRALLEVTFEAVEAAGYSITTLKGSQTGVFVGQMTDDYRDVLYRDAEGAIPRYTGTGVSRAITANRLSYFFDWNGPSMNIDTACSSSLVALHQAVQSLRSGESSLAVAAGVNLILGPELFMIESTLHMLSPSGRCQMWDAGADGYGRGEGVVAVVLKPLSQALLENDDIECIIRETGVNQDGRTLGGLTVPSAASQTALIRRTYARCGLDPTKPTDRCQYFEAHGTGTAAGDPKEAEAIRNVFFSPDAVKVDGQSSETEDFDGPLFVGSVKTVVGHSEGAAGLVGLLKASLAVQHGLVLPNLHFQQLSPAVAPFYRPNLEIPTTIKPWPQLPAAVPRRVSVNSFGFGGTNAHAIIESWSGRKSYSSSDDDVSIPQINAAAQPALIFPVSANSKPALSRTLSVLAKVISDSPNLELRRLAETLQSRRTEFQFRTCLTARTGQELASKLDEASKEFGELTDDAARPAPRRLRILAVFSGQGAQWPRMGAALFAQSPVFRNTILQLDASLNGLPDPPGWSLADHMATDENLSRVHDAEVSQPLTTALQIALVDLLFASGQKLEAVVGHSSGEIAAAYASGYLTASDAIRVAYYRGLHACHARSPYNGHSGSMIAVKMASAEAHQLCRDLALHGRITVAAINGPSSVTLAGDTDAISETMTFLDEHGLHSRLLRVNRAYHSHHMEPCADPYLNSLRQCTIQVRRKPSCKWYSSVYESAFNADDIDLSRLGSTYWVENLTKPVLFQGAVERVFLDQSQPIDLIVEIGPHAALRGPVLDTIQNMADAILGSTNTPYFGLLKRGNDDVLAFLDAIGRIWSTPSDVDWGALRTTMYGADKAQQVPRPLKGLPSYSWDHEEALFFESSKSKEWRSSCWPVHPLLGRATRRGGTASNLAMMTMTWRNILRLSELPWLKGHKFQNQVIVPASAYISMATDAVSTLATAYCTKQGDDSSSASSLVPTLVELEDVQFQRAIILHDNDYMAEMTWVVQGTGIVHDDEQSRTVISAEYFCYSGPAVAAPERQTLEISPESVPTTALSFSGKASITLSAPNTCLRELPSRIRTDLPLSSVSPRRFYSWLSSVGLDYSGDFVVKSISRRRNLASVAIEEKPLFNQANFEASPTPFLVHPAALDAAFQGVFAAYCFPGDGRIQAPYLPVSIQRVRVDLNGHQNHNCQEAAETGLLVADCFVRDDDFAEIGPKSTIAGDVDLFCAQCEWPTVQVEDIKVARLSSPGAHRPDLGLFARTTWESDFQSCGFQPGDHHLPPAPSHSKVSRVHKLGPNQVFSQEARRGFSEAVERVAFFHLKQLSGHPSLIGSVHFRPEDAHLGYLLAWANHTVERVKADQHPRLRSEWIDDSHESIQPLIDQYHAEHAEMQLVCVVGERLPCYMIESIRSSSSMLSTDNMGPSDLSSAGTTILDLLMADGKLANVYHIGAGFREANNLAGVAAARLAHRYPAMRILEIGAGTGAATASVLEHLGDNFSSYTFTDISSAFFADAKKLLSGYLTETSQERVRFSVLDIERPGVGDEYPDGGYDMVIAYNVLHATRSLRETLENCRRLLRPGGWLIVEELTSEMLYAPFIVSGLPGWWLGCGPEGDGRVDGPLVSEERWDVLLRETGFSGVDHLARDTDDDEVYCLSVMVSQAVDERVELLRNPLATRHSMYEEGPGEALSQWHENQGSLHLPLNMPVVLVGTGDKDGQEGSQLIHGIRELLQPVVSQSIMVIDGGLGALAHITDMSSDGVENDLDSGPGRLQNPVLGPNQTIPPGSAVVCIIDRSDNCDADELDLFSSPQLAGLQRIIHNAAYVLFITGNPAGGDPKAAALLGIGRTVMCESPHIRVHFVHVGENDRDASGNFLLQGNALAHILAKSFLQTMILDQTDFKDILWTNETEMTIRDGKLAIPRFGSDSSLNQQLASQNTIVAEDVPVQLVTSGELPVELVEERDGTLALQRVPTEALDDSYLRFKVLCSSLFAFSTHEAEASRLHICLGYVDEKPDQLLVTIASSLSSSTLVPEGQMLELSAGMSQISETPQPSILLGQIIEVLLCEDILHGVSAGIIWLHDAPPAMADLAMHMGRARGIDIFLSTSSPPDTVDKSSELQVSPLFIHPRITQRQLKLTIPSGVQRMIFFRPDSDLEARHLADTTTRTGIISFKEIRYMVQDIVKAKHVSLQLTSSTVWQILARESDGRAIMSQSHKKAITGGLTASSIDLNEFSALSCQRPQNRSLATVVSWRTTSKPCHDTYVPIRQRHPSTFSKKNAFFSPNKTYLLVGLSGQLGMSLIEWMASSGAKHFALVSRNPEAEAATLAYLRNAIHLQAHTWAVDVSDPVALEQAHAEMSARSDIPPIGGVVNGAMILRDKPFSNMTAQDFDDVMRPKAQGTRNIDRLFYQDTSLDFFIVLASSGNIVGNAGQANYNAANLFMTCITEQRRKRGLAASIIYLGAVASVGHLAKAVEAADTDSEIEQTGTNIVESQLKRFSNLTMSEQDFHSGFAAAIASGRPDSALDPGLNVARLGSGKDAPWESQPRFSLYLAQYARHKGSMLDGNMPAGSELRDPSTLSGLGRHFRQDLTAALLESKTKGVELLEKVFAAKLGVILQTPASKLQRSKMTPFVSLGVDSLVAVEMRSWLLKELTVDVPIFKILGGWSLADVSREVINQFQVAEDKDIQAILSANLEPKEASPPMTGTHITFMSSFEGEEFIIRPPSSAMSSRCSSSDSPLPSSRPSTPGELKLERVGDMSPAQARLFFLHQYLEVKSAYNVGYVAKFKGALNPGKLHNALHKVCMAHESLRSCYFLENNQRPVQAVMPSPNFDLLHKDFQTEGQVWEEIKTQRRLVFDIEHGHILRVTVMSLGRDVYHILFLHHHIAMDGVGWLLFVKDLDRAYSGEVLMSPSQQSIHISSKQLARWHSAVSSANLTSGYTRQESQTLMGSRQKLAFWADMHRNPHDPLPLFAFAKVRNRKVLGKYDTVTVQAELDVGIARRVKQVAGRLGVTPFHFYLSTLAVFLGFCLDTKDLSIGIVDANRPDAEDGLTMGYFLNMLPLRFRLGGDNKRNPSFSQLVRSCRDTVMDVLADRRAPLDAILDHLETSRSGSHHPLFQVALDFRQGFCEEQEMFGGGIMHWDREHTITAQNPYDIFINITQLQGSDRASVHWTVQRYMYDDEDASLMMGWYANLLDTLAREPDVTSFVGSRALSGDSDLVAAVQLCQGKSVDQIVATSSHTMDHWRCAHADDDTLIHQVERISVRYPESIAIVDDVDDPVNPEVSHRLRRTLTYSHLTQRMKQIANWLDSCLKSTPSSPACQDIVVGTILHPSSDYVCSLLGILRLGLTCVGLDLRNPQERLCLMLSDCRPRILICDNTTLDQAQGLISSLASTLPKLAIEILNLDEASSNTSLSPLDVQPSCASSQPAVILYTSGSTGTPKGVLLSHRNLHSHIKANSAMFGITDKDVLLQQTSPGFDFCLDQIFHALANGGRLVMVGRHGRGDPSYLARLIVLQGVTVTVGCPSEYAALLNYGGWMDILAGSRQEPVESAKLGIKWRLAFSGGEKLTENLRRAFEKLSRTLRGHDGDGLRLVNVYGPTEVTIACARGYVPALLDNGDHEDCESNERGDFLFPMPGYEIRILDVASQQPVPVGFPGEVCIFGEGVALGYLNRDEETRARFIPTADEESRVYYRSGDYGRLLEDGSLHLLGRIEMLQSAGGAGKQVKIRGMRVELDEIVTVMLREAEGSLNSVAVSYRGDEEEGSRDLLVAFVVLDATFLGTSGHGDHEGVIQRLRSRLPLCLPSYMCPSLIVPVEKLPVNVNGKLDLAAVDRLPLPSTHPLDATSKVYNSGEESTIKTADQVLSLQIPTEQQMRRVWVEVLGEVGGHHAIGSDSDFFQVGGSSMSAIKLRSGIREAFNGITLSLPDIFRLRTLRSMAAWVHESGQRLAENEKHTDALATTTERQEAVSPSINWTAEIDSLFAGLSTLSGPKPPILPQTHEPSPSSKDHKLTVLLTGATGFLGRHVLSHLTSSPLVATVHCLVRRRRLLDSTPEDSNKANKTVEHVCDLARPYLGLSPQDFAALASKVDVIIHNGAEVSFLQPYEALKATNTLSTRTLCEMALARRIPLHFVSSAAVADLLSPTAEPAYKAADGDVVKANRATCPALGPVSVVESLLDRDQATTLPERASTHRDDAGHGYAVSKAASEALLERASSQLGLPTCIHRMATLVSDSGSDLPQHDLMGAILKYSREIGAVPAVMDEKNSELNQEGESCSRTAFKIRGAFDFVSVEDASRQLVEAALQSAVDGPDKGTCASECVRAETKYVHHCSDEKILPNRLREWMARETLAGMGTGSGDVGRDLESAGVHEMGELDAGQWLVEAQKRGLDPVLYEYLLEVLASSVSGEKGGMTTTGQSVDEVYMPVIVK